MHPWNSAFFDVSGPVDQLRATMDAAGYKHLVLGPIFLKCIADTFAARRTELKRRFADPADDHYLKRESANRSELTQFINVPRVKVVPSITATADLYALVYATLRRKGQSIPANDLWIAASTLEHGAPLLTLDAHFQGIDGLGTGTGSEESIP